MHFDISTIYCKSLEYIPTEKKELLCSPQVCGLRSCLICVGKTFYETCVVIYSQIKKLPSMANSRLMQRIYRCLLLFFFLYAYLLLLSSVIICLYNILALEHQFSPGKSWNSTHWTWLQLSRHWSMQWLWFLLCRQTSTLLKQYLQ